MFWITLSLLTAITVACRDIFVRYISSEIPPMQIMALELFWSLPLLGGALFFVEFPQLDHVFWWNFIISLPLNAIAYYLYILALTGSTPISLCLPMLAFTPLFMIISGSIILQENISVAGGMGILLIVLGSYVLNIQSAKDGFWKPLTTLVTNSGSRYMLAVALIFSVVAVTGKKAMLHSSALFFSFSFFLVFNILFLSMLLLTKKCSLSFLFNKNTKQGLLLGVLLAVHVSIHGLAISIATSAYMVAIKRTSILFAVLLGGWIFKENNIKTRIIGALLMLIGAISLTVLP